MVRQLRGPPLSTLVGTRKDYLAELGTVPLPEPVEALLRDHDPPASILN